MFLEDAGFDWKVLGPDVSNEAYIAWQCDQDAYACSGQKCSAQSVLFMHSNWAKAGGCSCWEQSVESTYLQYWSDPCTPHRHCT